MLYGWEMFKGKFAVAFKVSGLGRWTDVGFGIHLKRRYCLRNRELFDRLDDAMRNMDLKISVTEVKVVAFGREKGLNNCRLYVNGKNKTKNLRTSKISVPWQKIY